MTVLPYPLGGLPTTPMAVAGMVAITAVVALFMTLLMISMTKERLELTQRNIAVTDPLTGLLNRRAFADEVDRRAHGATGAAVPATLLVLDLDRFKAINDRYGHEAGDQVLLNFARVMKMHARAEDMLFRMGGEEFCFLLPGVSAEGGEVLAQRICRVFGNSFVSTDSGDIRATVSIGVAAADTDDVPIGNLLAAADAALYEAKNSGRDQVMSARMTEVVRLTDSRALRALDRRRA
jgi:diguanylate cyclase (GGDEF)-like protein